MMFIKNVKILFLTLAIVILANTQSLASDFVTRQAIAARLLEAPCRKYQIPLLLALAIARQESDYHPYIINIQGKDYYPKTKEEALRLAQYALRSGVSFDVGLMQVNVYWIREYGWPLALVLDPENNAKIGCWILAKEIRKHGLNWKAVAYYHTPLHKNPEKGIKYARLIFGQMQKIRNRQ